MSKLITTESIEVCAKCKFSIARSRDPNDGYLCRLNPPTVQLVPLVPIALLPYVLDVPGWGPPPPELQVAVTTHKTKPPFYPLVHFPGVAGGDSCGQFRSKIERIN